MTSREEVISTLSKKFDPRSISWEFRAVLDVLQDEEPATVKELETAINERYECELFTYKQLYNTVQAIMKMGVIKNNPLTKQYSISPEHRTTEVRYLPISTYSIILFALSILNLIFTIHQKNEILNATIIVLIGALYLLAQYMGSEFNLSNGWKQFMPKLFSNRKRIDIESQKSKN